MTKRQKALIEKNAQYVHAGRVAAEQGLERIAPYKKAEQIRLWYAGYDLVGYIAENYTGK